MALQIAQIPVEFLFICAICAFTSSLVVKKLNSVRLAFLFYIGNLACCRQATSMDLCERERLPWEG
jgi:hypothetical protein